MRNAANRLQPRTPLRARTEPARVHILYHALTQRGDGIRTHGQLLSWMRLTTPRAMRWAKMQRLEVYFHLILLAFSMAVVVYVTTFGAL